MLKFILLILLLSLLTCDCSTSIKVLNENKNELNIKIQGVGVGGCDILLESGESDLTNCWCLWGTVNYSFCAYKKSPLSIASSNDTDILSDRDNNKTTNKEGRCPMITGETLFCSDLQSLGNCYKGAYQCTVDSSGLCHCDAI